MKNTEYIIAIETLIQVAEQMLIIPEVHGQGAFEYQIRLAIKEGKSVLEKGRTFNLRLSSQDYFDITEGKKKYKVIRPNQYNKNRLFKNGKPINYDKINITTTKGGEKLCASLLFQRAVILQNESIMKKARKGDYLIRFGKLID